MTVCVVDSSAGFAVTTTNKKTRPLHRTLGSCFDQPPSHLRPPGSFPTANDDGSFPANHVIGIMNSAGLPLDRMEEWSSPGYRPSSESHVDTTQAPHALSITSPRILTSAVVPLRDGEEFLTQHRSCLTLLLCRSRREMSLDLPAAAMITRSSVPGVSVINSSKHVQRRASAVEATTAVVGWTPTTNRARSADPTALPVVDHPRMGRGAEGRRPDSIGHATHDTDRSSSSGSCSSSSASSTSHRRMGSTGADWRSFDYHRWKEPGEALPPRGDHGNYHPLFNDEEMMDGGWDSDQQPLLSGLEVNLIKRWRTPLSSSRRRNSRAATHPTESLRRVPPVATPSSLRQ